MRIAAVDIGGTSIKSGFWDGTELSGCRETATDASAGGAVLMQHVKEILGAYGTFDRIGVSTAGQVNTTDGSIYYANDNIPGYMGMPVRAILEAEFGVPAAVENDVNAAALGELNFGAGRGLSDFLCLTYGTGVGGAIVIGRKIYSGASYSAGSFGGILVHPEAMRAGAEFSGCYEKYASTTALVRMMQAVDPALDNGRKIFGVLDRPEVKAVVDAWIDEIIYGLVTLVHVLNPSCILLGGGIMAQEYPETEIKRRLGLVLSPGFRNIQIRRTELGNHAGLMGAVSLAQQLPTER